MSLQGQWEAYVPEEHGHLVIEIDEFSDHFSGRICFFRDDLPIIVSSGIETKDKSPFYDGTIKLTYHKVGEGIPLEISKLRSDFPQRVWPEFGSLALRVMRKGLNVSLTVSLPDGQSHRATHALKANSSTKVSGLKPDRRVRTWDKFKELVGNLPMDRYIFRGQPVRKRLRTSFHRTQRKDLHR